MTERMRVLEMVVQAAPMLGLLGTVVGMIDAFSVLAQVKGPVAAQELHDAVSARFAYLGRRMQIKQQPHYAPIGFAGHEAGDFVLAPM